MRTLETREAGRPGRRLRPVPVAVLLLILPCAALAGPGPYRSFLGSLHDHTAEGGDDGAGTVAQALEAARSGGFDFFALSPHNHMIDGSTWDSLRDSVQRAYEPGRFVPLEGCEWGVISRGGHVGVIGGRDLRTEDARDWDGFYAALESDPDAPIVVLNHPKWARDFGGAPEPDRLERVKLVEILGGPGHSDGLDLPTRSDFFHDEYMLVLEQGWRCGVAYGEDDHSGQWGRVSRARMGLWATELTRDAVFEALRARRSFVTEDPAMALWIETDGAVIGGEAPAGTGTLEVEVSHQEDEAIEIALFVDEDGPGGAPPEQRGPVPGPRARLEVTPRAPGAWALAVARDASSDLCWSSPIWFGRARRLLPPRHGDHGTLYIADLNFSGTSGLQRVPGIGKGTARRIEEARASGVIFLTVEDLLRVEGVTEEVFRRIAPSLKVSTPDETVDYLRKLDRESASFVLVGEAWERLQHKQDRACRYLAARILELLIAGDQETVLASDLETADRIRESLSTGPAVLPATRQLVFRSLRFMSAEEGQAPLVEAWLKSVGER